VGTQGDRPAITEDAPGATVLCRGRASPARDQGRVVVGLDADAAVRQVLEELRRDRGEEEERHDLYGLSI
jgi:hypothetical protein